MAESDSEPEAPRLDRFRTDEDDSVDTRSPAQVGHRKRPFAPADSLFFLTRKKAKFSESESSGEHGNANICSPAQAGTRTSNTASSDSEEADVSETELSESTRPIYWASQKAKTPKKVLAIPWEERWKLNIEHREVPEGELELGRASRRITWLVEYARPDDQDRDSYIYFYNQQERYGGPFRFMSNFFPRKFKAPQIHKTHTFTTMEQFYQYCKVCSLRSQQSIGLKLPLTLF